MDTKIAPLILSNLEQLAEALKKDLTEKIIKPNKGASFVYSVRTPINLGDKKRKYEEVDTIFSHNRVIVQVERSKFHPGAFNATLIVTDTCYINRDYYEYITDYQTAVEARRKQISALVRWAIRSIEKPWELKDECGNVTRKVNVILSVCQGENVLDDSEIQDDEHSSIRAFVAKIEASRKCPRLWVEALMPGLGEEVGGRI